MKKSLFLNLSLAGAGIAALTACSNPEKKELKKPNILFCIADDASFPFQGAYGCTWVKTPAFDQVANAGILFNNTYTPNAKCAPSRACILTGLNSWQLKEAANHSPHFPAEFRSVVEILGENGYQTGYTGKGWAPGDPGTVNGQPRQLIGNVYNELKKQAPTSGISNVDYMANFKAFLKKNDGKPWFFWYGGFEPHRGYEYGSGISKGEKNKREIDKVPELWPDSDTVRTDLLDYAFEFEYFDLELAKMLDILKQTGQLKNTLVIVTADNGMPFPRIKGQEYELSNHLPMAIMWPDGIKSPGRKVDSYVNFIDFAPTFLELAGLTSADTTKQFTIGKSLNCVFQHTGRKRRCRHQGLCPDRKGKT